VKTATMRVRVWRRVALCSRGFATAATSVASRDCTSITPPYAQLIDKLDLVRRHVKRPLTLTEKILFSHLHDVKDASSDDSLVRGTSYLRLSPERVAMQDASAQ
jgi:homoaconitase